MINNDSRDTRPDLGELPTVNACVQGARRASRSDAAAPLTRAAAGRPFRPWAGFQPEVLATDGSAGEESSAMARQAGSSNQLLTAADVARRVQVHRSTIVRWADAGVGPRPIRFGVPGRSVAVRFDPVDVDQWLRTCGLPELAG